MDLGAQRLPQAAAKAQASWFLSNLGAVCTVAPSQPSMRFRCVPQKSHPARLSGGRGEGSRR